MQNPKIKKVTNFFDNLSVDTVEIVDEFYHPDAQFIDPLVNLHGSEKIKSYYKNIYQPVESIEFEFTDFICEDHKVAAFWTMRLQAPKLNKGKPFNVPGISQLHFDTTSDLVIFHRDYYDLGEFIYERIPVLSLLIKLIKARLSKH